MKKKVITFGILLSGLAISLVSYTNKNSTSAYLEENNIEVSEGEKLFKEKCTACHVTTKPEDMSKLIAPPMMGVMMHVKKGVKGENAIEKKKNVIDFIVDYVQNPAAEKSMFGEHAITTFGVMPSQKDIVSPEELSIIANYLYDNFPQKGMKGKGKNKGGCGSSCSGDCKH